MQNDLPLFSSRRVFFLLLFMMLVWLGSQRASQAISSVAANSSSQTMKARPLRFTSASLQPIFSQAQNPNDNWDPLFGIPGVVGEVSAVVVSGTDIYIGGLFSQVGGVSANNVAKWNGTTWMALGSGTNARVNALAVSGNDVYVGGFINNAGGVSVNNIAKWNGATWSALGEGTNERVRALAVIGNNVYAGGSFTMAGGISASRIARWDGTQWSALGSGMNSAVLALEASGNDLYAGGGFTTAGGVSANRVARWNGTTWMALGAGLDGSAQKLFFSGTDLYVGGTFNQAGSVMANYVARWNGATWAALGEGFNGPVYAFAVNNGELFAGGDFTLTGGISANGIAKWNGTSWSFLGQGVSGLVYALGSLGSNVIVGGSFSMAGNKPANNLTRYRNMPITNTPPSITAGAPLKFQQGSITTGRTVFLATVSDAETAPGSLIVTASASGVRFSNITNTNGVITADVSVNCTTTPGPITVLLGVSDGTAGKTATLTVDVTANTPPVLGTYAATSVVVGTPSIMVTPSIAPSDNGTLNYGVALAQPNNFTGTLIINSVTGAVTVNNPQPVGSYVINVNATDNCNVMTTQSLTLTVTPPNTAPTISAATTTIPRQQGSSSSAAITLATVSDAETASSALTVTATTVPAGLSVTNLVNNNGTITANIAAACGAMVGVNNVVLTVSDGSLTATANVPVNVAANTPPVLGAYAAARAVIYAGLQHLPAAAPSDNGSIVGLTATAAPGVFGPFTGNVATGLIEHTQLSPAGEFVVTVTATDNCQATATTTFPLTVSKLRTNSSISPVLGFPLVNVAGAEFRFRLSVSTLEGNSQIRPGAGYQVYDGNDLVAGTIVTLPSGDAEFRTTSLKSGAHTLTVRYAGDAARLASVSMPIAFYVNYPLASVSAASYLGETFAAEQIVAAFGTNLAPAMAVATSLPLPVTLAGVTVTVQDSAGVERAAPLFFVSPTQVNYLIPANTALGPAVITLANGNERAVSQVTIASTAVGIFTANAAGNGPAAGEALRVLPNSTQRYEVITRHDATTKQWTTAAIDLGAENEAVFLVLYGTGLRGRNAASTIVATIGGTPVDIVYAGAQGTLVGLDQVNLRLPRTLSGRGEVDVVLTIDGKAANPIRVAIK